MIKTVKLVKSLDVNICSVTHTEDGKDIEFLQPCNYKITWKTSAIDLDMDIQELTVNQNVTLHKIEHFLQSYVDNSIWYDTEGREMSNRHFAASENMLIVTPGLNFTILGLCLFAKLNSLCKPGIVVTDIFFSEESTKSVFEYTDLDAEVPESLPTQEEFMGEFSIWEEPWWLRDDVTTYDNCALNQEELDNVRNNIKAAEQSITSDFEQIEEQVNEMLGNNSPAEVIEVDFSKIYKENQKWKPTLI